jgi:hypothetical protein
MVRSPRTSKAYANVIDAVRWLREKRGNVDPPKRDAMAGFRLVYENEEVVGYVTFARSVDLLWRQQHGADPLGVAYSYEGRKER